MRNSIISGGAGIPQTTDSNGNPAGNVVAESKEHDPSPSTYPTGPITLDQTGVGGAIASGTIDLQISIHTALAGSMALIGFGDTLAEAQGNLDATVGSEAGHVVPFNAVPTTVGLTAKVTVPSSLTTPYYAIAENHATPTGKVMVSMRG